MTLHSPKTSPRRDGTESYTILQLLWTSWFDFCFLLRSFFNRRSLWLLDVQLFLGKQSPGSGSTKRVGHGPIPGVDEWTAETVASSPASPKSPKSAAPFVLQLISISLFTPFVVHLAASRCFLCSAWTSSSINSSSNSSSNSRSCSFSRWVTRACFAFSVSASSGCCSFVASGSVPFKRSSRLLTPKSPRMHCSCAACVSSSISSSSNNSSNSLSASRAWARLPPHLTDWKPFQAPTLRTSQWRLRARPQRAMAATARSIGAGRSNGCGPENSRGTENCSVTAYGISWCRHFFPLSGNSWHIAFIQLPW